MRILGQIVNDAVEMRRSYDIVMANDEALMRWRSSLPRELTLDEFGTTRSFASSNLSTRRIGVQSVFIRAAYHHVRFMLHRPYASLSTRPGGPLMVPRSLEDAVNSADRLITMICQIRTDFFPDAMVDVRGHMKWGDVHCFAIAIFFCLQLIAAPDHPGARMFRGNVRKALVALRHSDGENTDKAIDILQALAPLHSVEFVRSNPAHRNQEKAIIFERVKNLPVPYNGFVPYS